MRRNLVKTQMYRQKLLKRMPTSVHTLHTRQLMRLLSKTSFHLLLFLIQSRSTNSQLLTEIAGITLTWNQTRTLISFFCQTFHFMCKLWKKSIHTQTIYKKEVFTDSKLFFKKILPLFSMIESKSVLSFQFLYQPRFDCFLYSLKKMCNKLVSTLLTPPNFLASVVIFMQTYNSMPHASFISVPQYEFNSTK